MKIKYYVYFCAAMFLLFSNNSSAQRIRKDHREMTPSEKTAYVNALIELRNNGTLTAMANHHSTHFNTPIHSGSTTNGEFFLPWHRLFAFQMENQIRATSVASANNLCVPYWDWRVENTVANVTWDDAGFLQLSAINTGSYTITRSFGASNLVTQANITNMLTISPFITTPPSPGQKSSTVNRLTYRMEYWHDRGHNFIGGTMGGGTSPRDPIFFLHHNFVDKLWQEWYDSDNGIVKTPYTFTTPATTYWTWPSISPNVINDSRYMQFQATTSSPVTNEEVWYAYNKKLVLDGMNGIPFNVTGTNRLYCYTAWNGISVNGEIFAGDLKRDTSNNIIPDNRGGIKIKSGATCAFNAGSSINILPGFESEYGAVFEANVVALPCGFNSLRTDGEISDIKDVEEVNNENQLYVYSDLSNTISVNYTLYTGSKITIQLFNTMGQMVYSLGLGAQPEGYHQHNINIQLAAGIYFCRLVTDNSQQSVKFVY